MILQEKIKIGNPTALSQISVTALFPSTPIFISSAVNLSEVWLFASGMSGLG
jgi:hypothetical protein